jgi:hypothetical protein
VHIFLVSASASATFLNFVSASESAEFGECNQPWFLTISAYSYSVMQVHPVLTERERKILVGTSAIAKT